MDGQTSVVEKFAVWSDLVSLFLVAIAIYTNGVTPTVSVLQPPWKQIIFSSVPIVLLLLFSAIRFIVEGIFVTTGPREFLVIGVIYLARWLWLFVSIRNSRTATRGFKVARALLDLHTVRFGKSTFHSRMGADEIVVRKGKPRQGERLKKEERYWRGFVQFERYFDHRSVWFVELVEERLHARILEKLGVIAYKQESNPLEIDDIFRMIYQLVLSVDIQRGVSPLELDFIHFMADFDALPPGSRLASTTGCEEQSPLADVARRVAGDACVYIYYEDGVVEPRTPDHVRLINECIEVSVRTFVTEDLDIDV